MEARGPIRSHPESRTPRYTPFYETLYNVVHGAASTDAYKWCPGQISAVSKLNCSQIVAVCVIVFVVRVVSRSYPYFSRVYNAFEM
jgi:hypothetical protein